MAITLVPDPDYSGAQGIMQVRALQYELAKALRVRDWATLRRLDQSCGILVNRVVKASHDDKENLLVALKDLKRVYAQLIDDCQQEVAARVV